MAFLITRILRRLRHSEPPEIAPSDLDALLERTYDAHRSDDPDTHRQWARLAARIAGEQTASPVLQRPLVAIFGVAVIAVAAMFVALTSRQPLTDRYETRRGEQTHIVLPDSSDVTLNHTSLLAVRRFEPGEARRMSLTGEAHFRVRRNETPFIVSNGFAEVAVVGTEFNLRSRDSVLEVAVLHGTVRVADGDAAAAAAVQLTAGQRAIVRRGASPVRIDDIPSAEYPGWMHGKLFLTRASLEEACREISARFDVSVRVDGPSADVITGVLEASTAEAALRSLSLLTGKELRHDHAAYVLE